MTSQNPDQPAPRFTVTGQRETTQVTTDGTVANVVVVSFTGVGGESGTVTVPTARYSADTVRQAIIAKLTTMQAVSALNS